MAIFLLIRTYLLTALCFLTCLGSRRRDHILVKTNLHNCRNDVEYCTETYDPPFALVGCTDSGVELCLYRCPLGQPAMRYKYQTGRRCAAVCPRGYFLGMFANEETCNLHSVYCPKNESVILPGTFWHNTICGNPEHYKVQDLFTEINSKSLLDTLKALTTSWVRDIPGFIVQRLCRDMTGYERLTQCMFNFERMLHGMGSPAEVLYYRLNKLSLYDTAKQLYDTVVKPFVTGKDMDPALSIQFLNTNPLWIGERDMLVVETRLIIPLGTEKRYIPKLLYWFRGKPWGKWVLWADTPGRVSGQAQYDIAKGKNWTTMKSSGFFVHVFDISLVIEDFTCRRLDSLHVKLELYDTHQETMLRLENNVDVNCLWKPKPHQSCNCNHALLHYANPDGLCSPTCITTPFAHVSKGVEGSNNDWTLEITHQEPDVSIENQGRVVYGSVPPKTERFCLVTMHVFALLSGPTRDNPSAPLDMMRCDVVLVDVEILMEHLPSSLKDLYLPIDVRSLSKYNNVETSRVYIPLAAEDTLKTIIRQGWAGKIGVKLSFLHSIRPDPYQEELAAVLDWILSLQSQLNRGPWVIVINVNVETVKASDFDIINNLYGSRLELIPGISAYQIVDVIRSKRYYAENNVEYTTTYNYFKCSNTELCSGPITVYDKDDIMLYNSPEDEPIPACHDTPVTGMNCIVCRDRGIIIICPNIKQPVDIEDVEGDTLSFQQYTPRHQYGNHTQSYPFQSEQEQAETVLQQLGLLVASHGAFLNLDTISIFTQRRTGCERVRPGRWTIGEYTAGDPYTLMLPREDEYPERTGLFVFEELCKISNNRAGIVVTVPSSDYIPNVDCKRPMLLNRHAGPDHVVLDDNRVHYSMRDLAGIIADMAKWGVCRYSLGYLDYTFGNTEGLPTFTELSNIISLTATKLRTLHYRYTRNSTFGDGAYSSAHVDGVYKLEGAMFFQHATQGTPLTKSFVLVPGMPNLRLGLSSDMNVGAPLPVSEHIIRNAIERVKFIPYGAQAINLNYKDTVAFVDQDRDRICIHTHSSIVRSNGLRLPSFGIQSEAEDSHTKGCETYISGAEHRARLLVSLPITRHWRQAVVQSIVDWSSWLGASSLTREEEDWLSSKQVMKSSITRPYRQSSRGLRAIIDTMYLISKTVECIRGASSCIELGDYVDNKWPQGGTGYPIAISSHMESAEEILIKMIIHVNHGARRVSIPCELNPFSFGSEKVTSPQPRPGYYMQTEEHLVSKVKKYMTTVGPLTGWIVQPVALLYCPESDKMLADHLPSSDTFFQNTYNCVTMMNHSVKAQSDVFSRLGALIEENEKMTVETVKHVMSMSTRTSALCLVSTVLAVLISISILTMLCSMCQGSLYSQQRYRKLQ